MAIFSLIAKLGLDGTAFETGLKKSQSMAKGVGREISGALAGMFAVNKLVEFGSKAIETAGKLHDLSTRLGVSVEFLQEMQYAAEQSGGSLEDVAGAVEKISIARMKALAGDQATIDKAIDQFMPVLKKMDPRLVFATLADLGIKFSQDSKESI